mmetsp:Transcript_106188/g.226672  ORF Transcript_106188/g.226672 Transcript_106188/m.226672 type:complete len:772 (-) Transcript_106188:14-2329(-)
MLAVAKGTTMEELAKKSMPWSSSWKDVHMKIHGTSEELILPVMVSSKVGDVKQMLGEMVNANPSSIEFIFKLGPTYKRHRAGDEISSKITVKGIKSFGNKAIVWPDPFGIIGCGTIGLRMSVQMCRYGYDFCCFERMHQIGGNAWLGIANPTSKLQTEGPHYQLQYDPVDGNLFGMLPLEKYGYWPSRAEIIKHHEEVCRIFGASAYTKLSTEVVDIVIPGGHTTGPFDKLKDKSFSMEWKSTKDGDSSEGSFKASCIFTYPGCLVVPHRKTWPGEDICEMNIGYGFSSEFDYTKIEGQDALMVGMGAFAHENIRTCVEFGCRKVFNIARHFNLLMPRTVCWFVNQSANALPTAAMVLHSMKNMYDILNWDPWKFFSVTANADRSVATIKQYTRWGISDIYFLALYYDKAEIITGEVKRMKVRAAVLNNGRVIEDLDHLIKVIGFDGDFSVDRIHHCKEHHANWPDGDWRRVTQSDQSAIDASRFTNIALGPPACGMVNLGLTSVHMPERCQAAAASGALPRNGSDSELGSPCYHWSPREGTSAGMILGSFFPEMGEYEYHNNNFKKASMLMLAPAEKWVTACEEDWNSYQKMFKDQGLYDDVKYCPYPYTVADAIKFQEGEEELRVMEANQSMRVQQKQQEKQDAELAAAAAAQGAKQLAEQELANETNRQRAEAAEQAAKVIEDLEGAQGAGKGMEMQPASTNSLPAVTPWEPTSLEPARYVLRARARSPTAAKDEAEMRAWYNEGKGVVDYLNQNAAKTDFLTAFNSR